MKKIFKLRLQAFTLIEILLAVAALVILASIVIIAINPGKQLAQSRNAQRAIDINSIDKALKQYYIDHQSWPLDLESADLEEFFDICNTGSGNTANCINLDPLVPDYLVELPKNPRGNNYQIYKNTENHFGFYATNSTEHGLDAVSIFLDTFSSSTIDDILVFNFENSNKRSNTDFINSFYTADEGINANDSVISLNGSYFTTWVQGSGGAGSFAPNANQWASGANNKYWQINFNSEGYKNLSLSSKQFGSATGPRDFEVQWSLNGSNWTTVAGSNLTIANNWTSGLLNNINLPSNLNNQSNVYLRWIMTSNVSINGGTTANTGTNRIDDIIIIGETDI